MDPWGIWEGLPRDVTDRTDLGKMPAFYDFGTDELGNPILYENIYEHVGCASVNEGDEAPSWELEATQPCPSDCYECGEIVEPKRTKWIGPKDPTLMAYVMSLPVRVRQPEVEVPCP